MKLVIEYMFISYDLLSLHFLKGVSILEALAFYLSFFMALFLFSYAFVEGMRIANAEEKVYGGTFIVSVVGAFLFSRITYLFI